MTKPRYLTKSRFKLAVQCPTKLFYTGKKNIDRDTMQEDSFLAMLAEGGTLADPAGFVKKLNDMLLGMASK